MRLWHYEVIPLRKGIDAYRLVERELPMEVVLDQSLACAGKRGYISEVQGACETGTVHLQLTGSEGLSESFQGFIGYSDENEAEDFAREAMAAAMEALPLRPEPTRVGRKLWSRKRRLPSCFVDREHLEQMCFASPDRRTLYRRAPDDLVLYAEREIDYGGHRIPRRAFAAPLGPGGRERALAWFDGQSFGLASSHKTLPPVLALELEEEGRPEGSAVEQILPGLATQPLFLLRVPGRAEAGRVLRAPGEAPVARRKEPFFLVDTREPVPLLPGLPVVDEPLEALSIFLHAPDGIYLPGELALKESSLDEGPRWFVAVRLGA